MTRPIRTIEYLSPALAHRITRIRWGAALIALLLVAMRSDRVSHGQSAVLATRGIEEVGRSYIGEPLNAYIGHMAMLFVTGKHPTIGNGTMQDTVDWVNDPLHSVIADGTGGLAVYAHPDLASRVTLLHDLVGMELYNQGVLPSAGRDQMWDTVLNTYYTQGQPLIWAFAADDTHFTVNPGTNYNLAWNVSLLPSVDLFALKNALRTGAFYPSNGPVINGIFVSGTTLTLNLGQSSDVLWLRAGQYNTGAGFNSISRTTSLGASKAVKKDQGVTTSTLDIATLGLQYSDIHFVRAIVRQSGSSSKDALTQPFVISAAGVISNPYPATGVWVKGQSHNHVDAGIDDTTSINTYRSHYQAVGQLASFETAYSYWESPYQHPDTDGFPDVASVSPGKVGCASSAAVTVTGVNFVSGATVQLGPYPLLNIAQQSSTTLTATVSADVPPGVYDVVVTSPNNYRGTLAMGITVQDCAAVNDGWTTFTSPSLPWDQATSVMTTGDEVWVGTMKGAARYKNGTWSQFIPSGGLNITSRGIYDIAADPSGAMWFSSAGMWFRNAQGDFPWQWQSVDSKTSDRWGRMAFDRSGQLWVTSRWSEGIAVRSTSGRWSRLTNGLPNLDNQAITRDAQGNMWVGFNAGVGISKWNGSTWQNMPVPGGLGNYASALVTGQNGDVWAAVHPMNMSYDPDKSGVVRFIGGNAQTTEIYKAPQLPHPRVTDILVSSSGDVWFSSRAGVSRLNPSGDWQTFTTQNSGLVSDIVLRMAEDRDGRIWFATANGVSNYAPFDFALSNTGNVTVPQNGSGATDIVATLLANPASPVSFAVSGLPSGAAASFSSTSCSPSCSTVITIQAAKSSVPGTYPVTVTATAESRVRTTSFSLIVNDSNHKPTLANPGTQASAEGADVALDMVATDEDGDTLSYTANGLPGGLSLDVLTGRISGSIAFGAAAVNNVTVTVDDGRGGTAATNFVWNVTHTNRPPALTNPGQQTTAEDATASLAIQASDPDHDRLSFNADGLPTGLAIDAATGAISGKVAFGAAPSNAVTVTVSDGALTATTTFGWSVTHTNRAPVLTNPGPQTTAEGSTVTLALTASDPDRDTLGFKADGLPAGLAIDAASGVISGTVAFGAAPSNAVTITVNDGALTATTTFGWSVTHTNRAPVVAPASITTPEDTAATLPLAGTDPDNDALTFAVVAPPAHGSASLTGSSVIYTPAANYAGPDSFTFKASDGTLDSAPATVSVTVTPVNDAPVIVAPADQTTAENDSVTLAIAASDVDDDALSYTASGLPAGLAINSSSGIISGTVAFGAAPSNSVTVTVSDGTATATASFGWAVTHTNRAPALTNPGPQTSAEGSTVRLALTASDPDHDTLSFRAEGLPAGLAIDAASGVISGTVAFGAAASNAVTITASDTALAATATFDWSVSHTNRAPVATAASVTTPEDTAATLTLTGTDPDNDPLTFGLVAPPAHGSASLTGNRVTYTPAPNYAGTDSFTFKTWDGTADSAPATVSVTVTPVNDAPVIVAPANQVTAENDNVTLAVAASDVDGDTLSYTATGLPAGLAINSSSGVIGGTVAFGAAPSNSVTVRVSDGSLTAAATFTWSVTHTNRAPVANAASLTMLAGTAAPIALSGSDPDHDALTFTIVTPPAHGVVAGIGTTFTYTPFAGYVGADSFTFKANDGSLDSAPALVSLSVVPVSSLAATFLNPADHATNVDLTQPITWTAVSGAEAYYLYLGTSLGAKDLLNSGELQATSYRVVSAPPDVTLYARLWTRAAGVWRFVDVSFTAAAGNALTFIYPPAGVTSADMRQAFQWAPMANAQAYFLYVGTAPGKKDLASTGEIQATSYLATGLPLNQPLYLRLWVKVANVWSYIDRTITATATVTPTAHFITPTNGATNVNLSQAIQWTSVANAQAYYLYVGSSLGAKDLLNSGELSGTSYVAFNLPLGQLLYARLWTKVAGGWGYVDITFTATSAQVVTATVISPSNGAIGVGPTDTLQWTAVPDAQTYYVYAGSTPGAKDLIDSGEICATCAGSTATTSWNLNDGGKAPGLGAITDARIVYIRLWTMVGGVWRYRDSSFTTAAR